MACQSCGCGHEDTLQNTGQIAQQSQKPLLATAVIVNKQVANNAGFSGPVSGMRYIFIPAQQRHVYETQK